MMKVCILQGSPRENGNTAQMVEVFKGEIEKAGWETEVISLYGKEISPCMACRSCQYDWTSPSCVFDDDMGEIYASLLAADYIIFATPIYLWYCTAPMKLALDRMAYALNKYYGDLGKGPALLSGRKCGIITSYGYPEKRAVPMFKEGIISLARHFDMEYAGLVGGRHMGYGTEFMTDEIRERVLAFARELIEKESRKGA